MSNCGENREDGRLQQDTKRVAGAASGNRTRALSLEGRCATTTLWPLTPAASKPFSFSGGAPTGRGMSYCLEGTRSPLKTRLIVNPLDSKIGVKPGWNRAFAETGGRF
jgi:hypothetical protein